MPFFGFAHSELLSAVKPVVAIAPCTLTAGNTVYTASASPQKTTGIDTQESGGTMYRNLVIVVNVASITAGTLTISLLDAAAQLTTANVAANGYTVASLAAITAAGFYVTELLIGEHNFAATLARVVADEDNAVCRRYFSLKAVAAGGDAVFSAMFLFGGNKRDYPARPSTLAATWIAA